MAARHGLTTFSGNGAVRMFDAGTAHLLAVSLSGMAGACLAAAWLYARLFNVPQAPATLAAGGEMAKLRRRLARSPIALANRRAKDRSLGARLNLAGWNLTPPTFIALQLAAGLITFAGLLLVLPAAAQALLGSVLCGAVLPRTVLAAVIARRQRRFAKHFGIAVQTLVRGANAGLPFNRCLQLAAEACREPVRSALGRLAAEIIAGIPVATALDTFTRQSPAPETRIFAFTLALQYETGGSAAAALGNLTSALSAREQFTRKLGILTAEAKMSAVIIGALPLVVAGGLLLSSPDYLEPLWASQTGRLWLYGSGFWMLTGVFAIHRLTRLDIGR
jgi:tight adherence protein B